MRRLLAQVVAVSIFLGAQTLSAQTPSIASWNPYHGAPGTAVQISGSNLSTTSSVLFNGVPGTGLSIASNWSLTVTVPSGATTGPVTIINAAGSYTGSSNFT